MSILLSLPSPSLPLHHDTQLVCLCTDYRLTARGVHTHPQQTAAQFTFFGKLRSTRVACSPPPPTHTHTLHSLAISRVIGAECPSLPPSPPPLIPPPVACHFLRLPCILVRHAKGKTRHKNDTPSLPPQCRIQGYVCECSVAPLPSLAYATLREEKTRSVRGACLGLKKPATSLVLRADIDIIIFYFTSCSTEGFVRGGMLSQRSDGSQKNVARLSHRSPILSL